MRENAKIELTQRCFVLHVFENDIQSLEELTVQGATFLFHNRQEMRQHLTFQEETENGILNLGVTPS